MSERLLVAALALVSLTARLAWLDRPPVTVFDEAYYVNAARTILDLPRPADDPWAWHPPGIDPNVEHTPGAKLLVAGSIRMVGDNPWGWRMPSALLGTLAVLFLYAIARRLGAPISVAALAAFAFAFDDLVFVHARLATLDMPQVAFMLAGLYAYLRQRPVMAGACLAASAVCKITGLYGIAALVGFELLKARRAWPALGRATLSFAAGFPLLLGLLDWKWGVFTNPFEHLRYVLTYGYTLTSTQGSIAAVSEPWEWLLNRVPMLYFDGPALAIRAAMNPAVVFAAIPAMAFAAQSVARRRDEAGALALALFAATWLPSWLGAAAGRISYIFYFLPALPAIALGASQWVHSFKSRAAPWLYGAAVLVGFVWQFPYRGKS